MTIIKRGSPGQIITENSPLSPNFGEASTVQQFDGGSNDIVLNDVSESYPGATKEQRTRDVNNDFFSNLANTLRDDPSRGFNLPGILGREDDDSDVDSKSLSNFTENLRRKPAASPVVLSYPSDINAGNSDAELVHSVVFRIMARKNSREARNRGATGNDVDRSDENTIANEDGQIYLTNLGTFAASALVYKRIFESKDNFSGKLLKGTLGTLAFGAVNKSLGTLDLLDNNTTVDIQTAIELYLTQPPIAQYSANWENKELGPLAGGIATNDLSMNSLTGMLEGGKDVLELGARGIIGAAASLPGALGIGGDLAAGIEATTRKVSNPYKEQLFKSMGFRQFAFSYKFVPRNSTELETVMNIIQQFKYHMHPEKDGNLFLSYPSEFEIEYHYKAKENPYLSKVSTCALTDVKVTYGGQDAFTSFIDTDGAPSEIQMDLAFQELETLTNDRIGLNYRNSL